jgi:hypothetical protein
VILEYDVEWFRNYHFRIVNSTTKYTNIRKKPFSIRACVYHVAYINSTDLDFSIYWKATVARDVFNRVKHGIYI